MTQQSHSWAYTPRKPDLKETQLKILKGTSSKANPKYFKMVHRPLNYINQSMLKA